MYIHVFFFFLLVNNRNLSLTLLEGYVSFLEITFKEKDEKYVCSNNVKLI